LLHIWVALFEWFWNQVSLINGVVMGGGAGLSVPTRFRVVTEKAVSFSSPPKTIIIKY